MANLIAPYLTPVCQAWNDLLSNQALKPLQEFQGGYGGHNAWHTKYLRSEKDQLNNRYKSLQKRFNQDPEVLDLAKDNLARLTVLSGFERLFAIRQAYSVLKHRFFLPTTSSNTLGEICNQGFRNGFFKGALLNSVQFLGVNFNTLLWARGADFWQVLLASTVFETLFHPVDTVKTILYADTQGQYKGALDVLGKVVQDQMAPHLFRGLAYKLIYNAAFILHIRNYFEDSNWQYLTAPLWAFSYGFLTIKTRLQVQGTALSYQTVTDVAQKGAEKGLYRGVIPFLLLNTLVSHNLYGLYSQEAQDREVSGLRATLQKSFKSPLADSSWV